MHKVILKKNHWVWQDRPGNKETCCPNLMTWVQSRVWPSGPTWLPQAVTWLHSMSQHIKVLIEAQVNVDWVFWFFFFFFKENHETGDMAQWVRTHTALTVVPSSVSQHSVKWLKISCNSSSRESNTSGFCGVLHLCAHTHTHIYGDTHKFFSFLFLWDRVSLCRLGWTGPSACAAQMLRLKVCITTSGSIIKFFFFKRGL